ncbi:unnamed protein product [Symbiodinium sp. CCMP2592]|nr:unnamed protein product [Symbiodinium sp. CCMP2592]
MTTVGCMVYFTQLSQQTWHWSLVLSSWALAGLMAVVCVLSLGSSRIVNLLDDRNGLHLSTLSTAILSVLAFQFMPHWSVATITVTFAGLLSILTASSVVKNYAYALTSKIVAPQVKNRAASWLMLALTLGRGASDWLAFDMVATLVAGPGVGRIGVGFLNLPPVPLVVKRVTRGSWAEKQGIRCGDEFMSVDHRRSRAFTSSEFVQAMKKRPLVIKLRRTVRKEGAEVPVLPQLASFGAEAPDAQSTDQEEEEEEEEDEEEDEAEDMCPEKAQEVAEKLAKEVEANAKRDAERRSLSKPGGALRGSEETAPPSRRYRLSAPGVGEQLPKEMEKRLSLPSFQDDRLGDASWPKFRGVPRQEGETDPPDEEAAQQERSSKDSRSEQEEEGNMSCSTAVIDSSASIESTPTMDAAQSPSRDMEQKETEDEFF